MINNCSLIIPTRIDSNDRIRNLNISTSYLKKYYEPENIIIVEEDSTPKINSKHLFIESKSNLFYKTRCINIGVSNIKTKYFAIYDTDVLLKENQIFETQTLLEQGYEIVYPYDGRFLNVPKEDISDIERNLSVENLNDKNYQLGLGMHITPTRESFGGCVFFNKESFIKGGMANQNMISYGPEDIEFYVRFTKLGFKYKRVNGPIYHLTHQRGLNSGEAHPYASQNHNEFNKIMNISKEDLENYIKSWNWCNFSTK